MPPTGPAAPQASAAATPAIQLARGCSLAGARLAGADLRGLELSACDLRWADLRGADLRGTTLHGTRLAGACLAGARLAGAVGEDVDLEGADLAGADLSEADLRGAILLEASLVGASLAGARLPLADLRAADLAQADLSRADLHRADLAGAHLDQALLDGTRWHRTRITAVHGLSEADQARLLTQGAWRGALSPELAPLVGMGARIAGPGGRWLFGRAARLRSHSRRWLADRLEQREDRQLQRRQEAVDARRARIEALPGGPGQDISGQDLRGQHLEEVDWTAAALRQLRLDGAHLRDARLDGADLEGSSLRGTRLSGAHLVGTRASGCCFIDADLRGADLSEVVLAGSDLTGADLRGADLTGADLSGVDLTAARLTDLDLSSTTLDGAILDQADLAGARLDGAGVRDTDLRGALGISPEQRRSLADAGARTAEGSLDQLVRGIDTRHALVALGILALGLGAYVAARLAAQDDAGTPGLVAAEEIRTLPPAEAQARFEAMAEAAVLAPDKVGYLVEAAGQARQRGAPEEVERLLRAALAAAGEDVELGAEVRLSLATHLAEGDGVAEAMALVEPLVDLSRQTREQRARSILLYEKLAEQQGIDPAPRIAEVFQAMGELHDASAELHLALAGALANADETDRALEEVEAAAELPLSEGTALRLAEARARILDRAGQLDAAAAAWQVLIDGPSGDGSDTDGATQQAARLALADLRQRQGQPERAAELLQPLLDNTDDSRIAARAWLVTARLHEGEDDTLAAAEAYRQAIDLARTDPETAEEARLSLARVLGRSDPDVLAEVLGELDSDARAMVEVQARLGEARQALESADPTTARRIYEGLTEQEGLDAMTLRDARTGLGEALAQEGDVAAALVVWRDLLSETARAEDRVHLEVRIAQGLMRGGRLDEAAEAYAALAASTDADIATQGRLGQAQVQIALGQPEQARTLLLSVADSASDPAWRVRALEELADMATQDGDVDAALEGWRAVLGAVPPGHAAAGRARLAIVSTLSGAGRIDEALTACEDAAGGASSAEERLGTQITCAEVLERADRQQEAYDAYSALLTDLRIGALRAPGASELPADAAAGAARTALALDDGPSALSAVETGLDLTRDEGIRLNLLSLKAAALDALGRAEEAATARQARDAIVEDVPEQAAGILVEAANQARARQDWDEAVSLMSQARQAQGEPAVRAVIGVELGDVLIEASRLEQAERAYQQAAEDGDGDAMVDFQVGMGLAEVERRRGQPTAAADRLGQLQAPDTRTRRWLLEARARALAEAGSPEAPAAWQRLAEHAGDDDDIRSTALRGEADALFAVDRYPEALALYQQAAEVAPDPVLAGWSRLGAASALVALDRGAEAVPLLDALRSHEDPEISLQAAIQRSQQAAEAEDWAAAITAVQGLDAHDLGPAWDASHSQALAGALAGAGHRDQADAVLEALATRWPDEEEAQVPAWLARAELARQAGAEQDARRFAEQALGAASDPGFKAQAERLLASLQPD